MRGAPTLKVKAEPERAVTAGAGGGARPLGLYVHVPFCASTCEYCAFYQVEPTAGDIDAYIGGVAREAALVDWARPVTTVFWGGGTPGLLSARDIGRLAEALAPRLGGRPAEWTVELAPGSVTERRLEALLECGVTRLSMGVQSLRPRLLEALGRRHSREQALRAYGRVRAAGFASVNIDLMFALPGESGAEWEADLDEAIALAPDHISTYCLTFEEDTALWVRLSEGRIRRDVAEEAAQYERTWERLARAGYGQYEIANFARPGHACLHNLNTWRMEEWVGLGPSAASQHGGWRGANPSDLKAWLAGVGAGGRMTDDRRALDPGLLAEDALVFGLRMNDGVDTTRLEALSPGSPWAAVDALLSRLADEGLALRDGGTVRLTPRGRLLADAIGAEIMGAFRP